MQYLVEHPVNVVEYCLNAIKTRSTHNSSGKKPFRGAETSARIFDKTPQILFNFLQTADFEQESAVLIGRRFLLRTCGQNLESAAKILRSEKY